MSDIETVRLKLEQVLRPHVDPQPYGLLDFPDYSNVGDSAIWLGTVAYLKKRTGRRPAYSASLADYDPGQLERSLPAGTIYLGGGGNFGDLYPRHQQFREDVLARFPRRKIVQLPQSIHYEHSPNLEHAAAAAGRHRDFTLFVRDDKSLDMARAFDCAVHLAPDMAFSLDLQKIGAQVHDLLVLARTDKERSDDLPLNLPRRAVKRDWIEEPRSTRRTARLKAILRGNYYEQLAGDRLRRGIRLLSSGKRVATDRLHAHILSLMLGIPHTVADNSYGKLSSFIEAWTKTSPLLLGQATSLQEAVEMGAGAGD